MNFFFTSGTQVVGNRYFPSFFFSGKTIFYNHLLGENNMYQYYIHQKLHALAIQLIFMYPPEPYTLSYITSHGIAV